MKTDILLEHIVSDPEILRGKPIIRGTRVPVYLIVDWLESGQTPEEIVEDYPDLTIDDVKAAVAFTERERQRTEVRRW